ncbi:unnamed protein product [Sordaria macrospora k-hell]|uniref:DASH complex subunit DAM1 n=1 Tax=Sordaria macrospora (strain ATCC MYA-333 / DSM 997 / K(L3346) / K-hell) TaxID=771870 RepID=F7W3H4_SORMK|nr:uncharacterized protein SMAC_05914 [Sordaria macrospora k-hell]CCC12176.1 unnamed protein product [Sordaria macrospora k-hell]
MPESQTPAHQRSTSRPRTPNRPTTPLRPSSRSSLRESARKSIHGPSASFPLNAFEPAFAELADAMADLEANMMHFQLMHESLARFSEDFASFLYGLNMNAFCVDFPEGPLTESFKRMREKEEREGVAANGGGGMGQGQQGQHGQNMGGAITTVKTEREGFDGETTFIRTEDARSKAVKSPCAVGNDKRHERTRCWPWCYAQFPNDEPRRDY